MIYSSSGGDSAACSLALVGPNTKPQAAGENRLIRIPACAIITAMGPWNRSQFMQLGMVGLGRMGANMVRRLMRGGHQCVVYDVAPAAVQGMRKEGAVGAASLDEFVQKLTKPRAAWVMVPLEYVE